MNIHGRGGDGLSWLRDYSTEKRVEVDLHGYSLATADEVALAKVREAYENGFRQVTFIHGWSTSRQTSGSELPVTIRELLHDMLRKGDFEPYAYIWYHKGHIREGASLTLALRSNPQPLETPFWSPLPPEEYPRQSTVS